MIDIENTVQTRIYNAVISAYPNALVAGEYLRSNSQFPAVTVIETSNTVHQRASAMSKIENAVDLLYDVNVYSNKTATKKSEAKAILSIVDAQFEAMGFIRTYCQPIANVEDATIYRIVARYSKIQTEDD